MIHKCPDCGYIYDFEMEPSGFNENGDVVCGKCAKPQKIGTIMIDGSDGFHAIMTNDRKVFKMKQTMKVFLLRLIVISALTFLVSFGMLLMVNGFQYPTSPSGVIFIACGSVYVVIGGILLVENVIKTFMVR